MKRLQRFLAILISLCIINAGMIQSVHAGMISTEEVARLDAASNSEGHARLNATLARADVRAEMERMGVDPVRAHERVAALTDTEAARLADQIDSAPAAGIGWVEGIVIIFFTLMVTDWLGLTKIFPFTRTAGSAR